ncbi:Ubiquitin family protein [Euphorbia peplus]|nr:Ubiquitin family protein [Euphorbia peplus]
MQVHVKGLTGLTGWIKTLKVESSNTIGDLKAKIQSIEGLTICQQSLIFEGEQLRDGCTISDYNIQNQDTIYLYCIINQNHR